MTTDTKSVPRRPLSKRHAKRLLNVARALRESKHPEQFTMTEYVNPCGTPACDAEYIERFVRERTRAEREEQPT